MKAKERNLLKGLVVASLVTITFMAGKALVIELLYDPLIYIEITPRNIHVKEGKVVKLNVEGIYTSATMPIKADWYTVRSKEIRRIPSCRQTESCKIMAEGEGMMLIQTRVWDDGLLTDGVRVRVDKEN